MNDLLQDNLKIPISHYILPNSVSRPLKMFYYLSNASRFTNFSHAFRDHVRKILRRHKVGCLKFSTLILLQKLLITVTPWE